MASCFFSVVPVGCVVVWVGASVDGVDVGVEVGGGADVGAGVGGGT